MDKKELKISGILLMILTGVVLFGMQFKWTYSTWRTVDWIIIGVCGFIGYKLYNENK